MGKHNKARRSDRCGKIVVAAAAATVIGGWAAPLASAEGPDTATTNTKPSNPISKTADAVKSTVAGVQKAVTDAAGSFQKAAQNGLQVGSGGAGTSNKSVLPKLPNSSFFQTNTGTSRKVTSSAEQQATLAPGPDDPTGSVTLPIVDVTLPYLPDPPTFAFPTPGAGLPPSFGSQGTNTRFGSSLPARAAAAATNGNNLLGLNFFEIGDNNLLVANNIGTGLQGIIAGDNNTLAGNQFIVPGSSGTNFGWMGNNNGSPLAFPPVDLDDLQDLDPAALPLLLLLQPSGTNVVGGPFSYGNNTFIMGNDNQGTGNNVILGAGDFGNNMHWIGDGADRSGNNTIIGLGSIGNNMSIIGDRSERSGNNSSLGAFGFANNMGLIGSAASRSGNNENVSPFGGFAQNFVLVGDAADGSGNNSNLGAPFGFAQNVALIGAGADGSGNNEHGGFNFALVGPGVDNAGNNKGGGFNVAILPRPDQNCNGPACFNFLGAQFGN